MEGPCPGQALGTVTALSFQSWAWEGKRSPVVPKPWDPDTASFVCREPLSRQRRALLCSCEWGWELGGAPPELGPPGS